MDELILLGELETILGPSSKKSKNNYAFHCPKCNHPKKKLEVNLRTGQWNCWVCSVTEDFKGKSIKSLLNKLQVPQEKRGNFKLLKLDTQDYIPKSHAVSLPKEYIPLTTVSSQDIIANQAKNYLKTRGLGENDIIKYKIGFCKTGKYEYCIIVPSYDENGQLNFFSARNFNPNSNIKYIIPEDISKDIIGFELYINWSVPIILVEGVFDALAVKRNVIPLFGNSISESLMKKLVQSQVTKIYIALDKDAQKIALKHVENLMNYGKKIYLVDPIDKDPSKEGFNSFTKRIQNQKQLTFQDILLLKLQ